MKQTFLVFSSSRSMFTISCLCFCIYKRHKERQVMREGYGIYIESETDTEGLCGSCAERGWFVFHQREAERRLQRMIRFIISFTHGPHHHPPHHLSVCVCHHHVHIHLTLSPKHYLMKSLLTEAVCLCVNVCTNVNTCVCVCVVVCVCERECACTCVSMCALM